MTGLYQDAQIDKSLIHASPRWSTKGKAWKSTEEVKTHLNALKASNISISPLWLIVEFSSARQSSEIDSYPAVAVVS